MERLCIRPLFKTLNKAFVAFQPLTFVQLVLPVLDNKILK